MIRSFRGGGQFWQGHQLLHKATRGGTLDLLNEHIIAKVQTKIEHLFRVLCTRESVPSTKKAGGMRQSLAASTAQKARNKAQLAALEPGDAIMRPEIDIAEATVRTFHRSTNWRIEKE